MFVWIKGGLVGWVGLGWVGLGWVWVGMARYLLSRRENACLLALSYLLTYLQTSRSYVARCWVVGWLGGWVRKGGGGGEKGGEGGEGGGE